MAHGAAGRQLALHPAPVRRQGLRLDLADTAGVAVELNAIVLNDRQPWQEYFVPSAWQLFWLAVLPGLAGCALTLKREKGEDD